MILLLICSGCDDAENPCSQAVPAGCIQGFVYSGGLPIKAVIAAVPIVNGTAMNSVFQTEPNNTGSYSMDVPEGTYVLQLQIQYTNVIYNYADTIFVDGPHSPIVADFHFGGIAFEFNMSENLDGERVEVSLHRRNEYGDGPGISYLDRASERIEAGQAIIYMQCVLPGEYQIEVVLGRRHYLCNYPYDGEHIWLPETREPDDAQWYEVVVDSTLHFNEEFALEPARIEGRISGAWLDMGLSPAPDLSIVDPDSATVMGRRRVNDDGSFAIDIHLPGPVKLLATHYGIEQWIGGHSFDEATVFTLQLGETTSNIELIQSGLRLALDVPEDFLGSARIHLYDPINLNLLASGVLTRSSSSYAGLPNLWPGDFLIQVSPTAGYWERGSWRTQWFDRVTEPLQAQVISIPSEGTTVNLNLVLEMGGDISGQILQDSDPPKSYYIVVSSADETVLLDYEFAYHGHAEYYFPQLPDGEFKIGAFLANEDWNYPQAPPSTVWYPGTTDWSAASLVEILDAASVSGIDIDVR